MTKGSTSRLNGPGATRSRVVLASFLFLLHQPIGLCDEQSRLPATASAERSAAGYGAKLAVDSDQATVWVASLEPTAANNRTWFQLDLGTVQPVARLHWLAARGAPYPASAPTQYRVVLSTNAVHWFEAHTSPGINEITTVGNILLNADARYVRLETTMVNDGTGWALGLREIWVTGGWDNSFQERQLRPRISARNQAVSLTWNAPRSIQVSRWNLFRAESPSGSVRLLSSLPGSIREYKDSVPNWTPCYFRVEAIDEQGKALLRSDWSAGFAHPAGGTAGRIETFAFWYERYEPSTASNASIKHIGDAAFVIGPPAEAAADLAGVGKGLLPYVTFYQTAGWAGSFGMEENAEEVARKIESVAFYSRSLQFTNSPAGYAPSVFCRPGNVEYDHRAIQYTLCPNSAPLRSLILAHVRKQLENGASGFFVDNGFQDDIAAEALCESTKHAHFYGPGVTSAEAFLGLLLEVSCEIKKRHSNGVLIVNGGVPASASFYGLSLGDVCGGQLWESYLRSSHATPGEHKRDWENTYRRSVDLEKASHTTPPRRMFVLSYPWTRQEAYFCYCTAKLCDLPWSASLGINDPHHLKFGGHFGTYPELINLRLGAPVRPQEYGGVKTGTLYVREYEHGLVLVNPTRTRQKVSFPLNHVREFQDIYSNTESKSSSLEAQIPPESGRVYLWRSR